MSEATKPADAPPPSKKGPGILGMLLPAVIAGAAAFGGAKIAGAHAAHAAAAPEHAAPAKPPGPTIPLEPFLVTIQDANKKIHPMKVTIAIECEAGAKEEQLKAFSPRIRDAALAYLRTLTYEDAIDPKTEKLRGELVEHIQKSGATFAERILVTDLVVQ